MTRSELATAKKLFKQSKWISYFTKLYKYVLKNQELFLHPATQKLSKEEWKTIAWNSACVAVWTLQKEIPEVA